MVVKIVKHCSGEIIEWKWSSDNILLPSPYWTSCFLIDGLLIDSGAPGGELDLQTFISSLPKGKEVKKCIITHAHEDHCGGAAMLQSNFGIPVFAGELAVPLLKKEKSYPDYRKITWGFPYRPFDAIAIKSHINTPLNKYSFKIVNIPGHAEEEIALIEEKEQWAIIADGIMPRYTMIFSTNTDIPEDISKICSSLQLLERLTSNMENLMIFTSGRGVFRGRSFINEKINEIKTLHKNAHRFKEEALKLGYKKKKTIRYIIRNMFGKETFIGQFTRGDLSIQNLVISLLDWPLN